MVKSFSDEVLSSLTKLRCKSWEMRQQIHRSLLKQIRKAPKSSFLLPAISKIIGELIERGYSYTLSDFERWCISELSIEEQLEMRQKICGGGSRGALQTFFPIGLGQRYAGNHFVIGHTAPDLDALVASFWSWVDAFSVGIGDELHIWSLPGGDELDIAELPLIQKAFGKNFIQALADCRKEVSLCARYLYTPAEVSEEIKDCSSPLLIVDKEGFWSCSWNSEDQKKLSRIIEESRAALEEPTPLVVTLSQICFATTPGEDFLAQLANLLGVELLSVADAWRKELWNYAPTIKGKILEIHDPVVDISTPINEMLHTIQSAPYLSVLDGDIPVGIIEREKLLNARATASLRDFSNRQETTIANHIEIISVLDHHKSQLETNSPARIHIADVQACSTLLALEDRGPLHQERRKIEAWHLLLALFDDTDALSKHTPLDIKALTILLKTIKPEINWSDSVEELLKEIASIEIYAPIAKSKEDHICQQIEKAVKGERNSFFADAKWQQGYAHVGQSKLKGQAIPLFEKHAATLRKRWLSTLPSVPLALHMISTIEKGTSNEDQLWIYLEDTGAKALEKLLKSLRQEKCFVEKIPHVSCMHWAKVCANALHPCVLDAQEDDLIILTHPAGAFTSRKDFVAKHLPKQL